MENSFSKKIKFEKPLLRLNTNDFDDDDINSSFSDKNNENEEDSASKNNSSVDDNTNKNKSNNDRSNALSFVSDNSSDSYNSNEKVKLKKQKTPTLLIRKSNNNNNLNNNRYNYVQFDEKVNDKYPEKKNMDTLQNNGKIEKAIIKSIDNKESMNIQIICLAEKIKFRNIPDKIISTDEYGFIKEDNIRTSVTTRKKEKNTIARSRTPLLSTDLLKINARVEKWAHMIKNLDLYKTKKIETLKERTRKGIPDNLRGYVWQKFAEIDKYYVKNLYQDLVNKQGNNNNNSINENSSTTENNENNFELIILKDLDRTFPLCQFFRDKYGDGQRKLYRILSAYSKYNPDVGYVQGMGFICAIFLIYMDEESSFFMMHSLMKKYKLEGMYLPNFPYLKKMSFVFLKMQKKFIPKIYHILKKNEILPTMYSSGWFICIFSKHLPFNIAVRIFDIFLLEGLKTIYRIGLALLKRKENEFIKSKGGLSSIMPIINSTLDDLDVDSLLKDAFSFKFSKEYIEHCENEYERVKNDRKNEFMALL